MSKTMDKSSKKRGRDERGRFITGHKEGFQPGNNANPAGRPKRKTLTEILVAQLDQPCPNDKHGRTWGEVIVTSTLAHGVKGQGGALAEVWNRSDGKVVNTHEISGPEGGPIELDPVKALLDRVNAELDGGTAGEGTAGDED